MRLTDSPVNYNHTQDTELLVNVTKHVLVPEHQVISPEETKALLEKYTAKETQVRSVQFSNYSINMCDCVVTMWLLFLW